jgi:septal ring factor EnvC (AmiA/AmiB activator)
LKFQKVIPGLNKFAKYLASFFIVALLFMPSAYCQTRKSLESKRLKLLKEIQSTAQLLNRTAKDKTATLDRYMALQQQITARQELIETLHAELEYAEESLARTSNVVFSLEDDMTRLEKEYGIMARNAFRQKMNNSNLLFIFSSVDFNEAFQRWQYLKQFNAYRKRQATLVVDTQHRLKEKMAILEERKQEKKDLLQSTEEQKMLLAEELNSKSSLLASLQDDESRLQKELTRQQDAHRALNDAIEEVIQKEVLAARKRERSREQALKNTKKADRTVRTNPRPARTPEANVSSANFISNKGNLPWPVTNGVIVKHFGKQPHPTLERVVITNNGIDIQTNPGAEVRAVFDGLVVGKQFIPGYDNMLIIKHGNYYTVYSNLKEVLVKKEDTVKTRQAIGVASQKGNVSQVHFEVWQDKVRLNPASWINSR